MTVQNLAQETGRWGGQVRGSPLRTDRTGRRHQPVLYSTADFKEQQILNVSHSFRPGSEGLTIGGQFTYAWTETDIGGNDATPDPESKTLFWTIDARYSIVRRQSSNLWAAVGFDFVDQKVDFFGPLTRDKLRLLAAGAADWDAVDMTLRRPGWQANAFAEVRRGLGIFDASNGCDGLCGPGEVPPSRFDGDATATVLGRAPAESWALGRDFAIAVSPRLQYALDALLSFEEFTAGNYTVGRGYDPATLSGDSGVGLLAELRGPRWMPTPIPRWPGKAPACSATLLGRNKNDGAGADHLASAGGGVRAELGDRFRPTALSSVCRSKRRDLTIARRCPGYWSPRPAEFSLKGRS